MKRALMCTLGILLILGCGAVLAQSERDYGEPQKAAPAPTDMSISGKVVSSSATSLVIKTDSGTRMTFTVDSASNLPVGIGPGDRITVEYDTLAGGMNHAARVTSDTSAMPPPPNDTRTTIDTAYGTTPEGHEHLPRTASPLPLIALIGALSLGAAAGTRMISRLWA